MKFSDFSEFELESSFIECIDCGVCLEFNELNDEPHFLNVLAVGKTIKEYQCDECNSKKYEVSHPEYSDFPEIIILITARWCQENFQSLQSMEGWQGYT